MVLWKDMDIVLLSNFNVKRENVPVAMVVCGVQLNMQIVFIYLVLMDEILILIISSFLIGKVCSPRLLFLLHTKPSDQTLWQSDQSCFVLGSPKFKFGMTTICVIRLLVLRK